MSQMAREASKRKVLVRSGGLHLPVARSECRAHQRWRRLRSVAARGSGDGYRRRRGQGAGNMSTLKDRYLPVCDRLVQKVGTEHVGHRIRKDATLKQCVGYLNQYIVDTRTHFRYMRYFRMVDHYFRQHLGGSKERRRPLIVHVDLGTGPGIFNWVVYDYVQQKWRPERRPRLAQFGYDRCSAMVELAERIWTKFNLSDEVQFFDSRKALRKAVRAMPEDAYLLITFGHVLIQSYNLIDRSAISSFAKLCNQLAHGRDMADVLAVDAYTGYRTHEFELATKCLYRKLRDSSDATAGHPWSRMRVPNSVLPKGSRALLSLREER